VQTFLPRADSLSFDDNDDDDHAETQTGSHSIVPSNTGVANIPPYASHTATPAITPLTTNTSSGRNLLHSSPLGAAFNLRTLPEGPSPHPSSSIHHPPVSSSIHQRSPISSPRSPHSQNVQHAPRAPSPSLSMPVSMSPSSRVIGSLSPQRMSMQIPRTNANKQTQRFTQTESHSQSQSCVHATSERTRSADDARACDGKIG